MDAAEMVKTIVDRWCPAVFEHEQFEVRALRALMQANAYVLDLRRVMGGLPPIRPLDDYLQTPVER